MVRTDNSDFLSRGEIDSSVHSTNPQHPDSHVLPSLDRQRSILSLLDVFQHTISDDMGISGSMNIDELLNNVWTEEEIQAFEQTLLPSPDIALGAAAPMGAATVPTAAATANINPQFIPSNEEMNLEDFLIMAGVVRAPDYSSPLQQSCVSYQNNNNTTVGSGTPGCMVRPVIASGGGRNVPAYQTLLEKSDKDAASAAIARKHSGYQPREGGFRQGSADTPVSSDSIGGNNSDSVNNLDINVNLADKSSHPESKEVSRKQQRRVIKNREFAARSRARKEAYTRDLEAQLHALKAEKARLQQKMQEMKRMKQQNFVQEMDEVMKASKGKGGKKGLKRSWSSLY
ncbi:ABSCISIC ACID-INSENSITIVE 5-like protein 4 isoform X1 [Apium graveolens]|uniref:ABSCISIC ACID-INSENSITIVE 5-like protein 4 isoform X1 n=1 Tax=Apium graveolens TaxID=4045 RepID=UPI003D78BA07